MSELIFDKIIGRGGFGEVYVGKWNYHKVAIKKFFLNPNDNQLIQQEIDIIKNLRSRYIIQFYGIENYNGSIVMITDYAERGSLATVLENSKITLNWDLRLKITNDIIKGLAFLHGKNIIHRDLKSSNILMNEHYEAKLCDFGLAKIKERTAFNVGTLRWMAPELFSRRPHYDYKSDIYSLAMVMWEIASRNTVPFSEIQENSVVIQCIKDGEREDIPDGTPDKYAEMIERCWQQTSEKRPMARDLILEDNFDEQISENLSNLEVSKRDPHISYHDLITLKEMTWLSENNNVEAMINLGDMHYFGHDTTANINSAIKWYEKAANMGNVEAMYTLAYVYSLNGDMIHNVKDETKFKKWIEKATLNHEHLNDHNIDNSAAKGDAYYFGRHGIQDHELAIQYYEQAASNGDVSCMYNLGTIYNYLKKDKTLAKTWNEKGHALGYIDCTINLATIYYNDKEYKKAVEYYTKAAEQGLLNAQTQLGILYLNSEHVETDYEKAVKWSTKAAEQGDSIGQTLLAVCYYDGKGVEKDYKKAVEWLSKAAEQGQANAQTYLALRYYGGEGVEKDYKKAVEWLSKAAEQGLADAQTYLGIRYYNGEGVEKDYKQAVQWWSKAAEQGLADAQNYLGLRYYSGEGVEKDYKQAVEWLSKAAEQGQANAQTYLALSYYGGEGVEKDYKQAVEWWSKAAEQGHAQAQNYLGIRYYNGEGVEKDYKQAVEWFTKAAEAEVVDAQFNLGYYYYDVEKDYKQAKIWLIKAADAGHATAQNFLASSSL
jgi:TPR repeat protein